jgi:hypothetical protein
MGAVSTRFTKSCDIFFRDVANLQQALMVALAPDIPAYRSAGLEAARQAWYGYRPYEHEVI